MEKAGQADPAHLPPLVRSMLRPGFYRHRPSRVRLIQTHVSWVFLAGDFVYKVKKPKNLGFLDFSTPGRRSRACRREVELNRRLAPGLYLGVVPVFERTASQTKSNRGSTGDGGLFSLTPPGRVVEHAVVMHRLPQERVLTTLLKRRAALPADLRRVARRVAAFHAGADLAAVRWRRVAALEESLRENFRQTVPFLGKTVGGGDYLLVWDYNHDFIVRRRALLEKRAREGRIRDGHGDLHAEHVVLARGGVLIYDCIEFSDRLRQCDVAADIAFLYMDLLHFRRPDLAGALMEEYLRRSGDWEVRLLVPFYACYRAVVREKVESLRLADPGLTAAQKRAAARRAAGYFSLARQLARRDARPRLILVGGLPGSGKSTVALALAGRIGADCIGSDALRKELAGVAPGSRLTAPGAYGPKMTELTYRELLVQAERQLLAGRSVVLDATFARGIYRRRAAALARTVGALFVAAQCRCPARVAGKRLATRRHPGYAGASDAGEEVLRSMRRVFEPWPGALPVDTTEPLERCLARIAALAYPL